MRTPQKSIANHRKAESSNTKPPGRRKNSELRPREYLLSDEVDQLIREAKTHSRYPVRDGLIILMGFRHGLRAGELVNLQWSDIDWRHPSIYIRRLKGSRDCSHRIEGDELRLLRQHSRQENKGRWIFMSERRTPLTVSSVHKMVKKFGLLAGLDFQIHPHMLRHACGYYLANKGYDTRSIQDYLGHKNIQHTVAYTTLAPSRFDHISFS